MVYVFYLVVALTIVQGSIGMAVSIAYRKTIADGTPILANYCLGTGLVSAAQVVEAVMMIHWHSERVLAYIACQLLLFILTTVLITKVIRGRNTIRVDA